MSIKSVDVEKIEQQIKDMINQMDDILKNGEDIEDYKDTLENKFKFLKKSSETLFKYIITNYAKPNFNKENFDKNINMMLGLIKKMQNSNLSQHDASVIVGEELASQYIPQLKNKELK